MKLPKSIRDAVMSLGFPIERDNHGISSWYYPGRPIDIGSVEAIRVSDTNLDWDLVGPSARVYHLNDEQADFDIDATEFWQLAEALAERLTK